MRKKRMQITENLDDHFKGKQVWPLSIPRFKRWMARSLLSTSSQTDMRAVAPQPPYMQFMQCNLQMSQLSSTSTPEAPKATACGVGRRFYQGPRDLCIFRDKYSHFPSNKQHWMDWVGPSSGSSRSLAITFRFHLSSPDSSLLVCTCGHLWYFTVGKSTKRMGQKKTKNKRNWWSTMRIAGSKLQYPGGSRTNTLWGVCYIYPEPEVQFKFTHSRSSPPKLIEIWPMHTYACAEV